jgi:hypothetical protein
MTFRDGDAMKYLAMFFLSLIVCSMGNRLCAQETRAFEVPEGVISVLFVPDPKSPIQLSGPTRLIGYSYGGLSLGYTIQNTSSANVKSFLTEQFNWFDSRGYSVPATVNESYLFSPLVSVPSVLEEEIPALVPFDAEAGKKSGLSNVSNRIWIVMVVKVETTKGTIYDASKKYRRLKQFIDELNVNGRMSPEELDLSEKKLRAFVSELNNSK